MSDYCQVYRLSDLRRYPGWVEPSGDPVELGYLWADLVVRASALDPEQVLFHTDAADWATFCRDTLDFQAPVFQRPRCGMEPAVPAPDRGWLPFGSGQTWLLEQVEAERPAFRNPLFAVQVPRRPDPVAVEGALAAVLQCHDALRLRLGRVDGRWAQTMTDDPCVPLTWVRLSELPEAEATAGREAATVDAYRLLCTLHGPMARFLYFELRGEDGDMMVVLLSHILADGLSQFVLNSDLHTVLAQAADEQPPAVAPAASFEQWAWRVDEARATEAARREVADYWLGLPWDRVEPIPVDFPEGRVRDAVSGRYGYGTQGSEQDVAAWLSVEETRRALRRGSRGELGALELIVTALAFAYQRCMGSSVLYVAGVDNNRQSSFPDMRLERMVAMAAQLRRVLVDVSAARTADEVLAAVQSQLNSTPNHGRTLEWLLRGGDGRPVLEELRRLPGEPHVFLMYRGRAKRWSARGKTVDGSVEALNHLNDQCLRTFPIDCIVEVLDDQLLLKLVYSPQVHRRETIAAMVDACVDCLRDLSATPTPS